MELLVMELRRGGGRESQNSKRQRCKLKELGYRSIKGHHFLDNRFIPGGRIPARARFPCPPDQPLQLIREVGIALRRGLQNGRVFRPSIYATIRFAWNQNAVNRVTRFGMMNSPLAPGSICTGQRLHCLNCVLESHKVFVGQCVNAP